MTTNVMKHSSDCPKCAICQCRCCINKRTKNTQVKKSIIPSDRELNTSERRCLLILVRHGTTQDDVDKRYSGWNDCDLAMIGKEQMHRTGQALRQANFSFDLCFTSVLKRASKSLFIIQEEMDNLWLPVYNTWRLNDRMLGSLTGFHRDRAEALFGQNQIKEWLTRSELAPPPLEESSALHPRSYYKYRQISSIVPSTETLIDIRKRVMPFFYDQLLQNLYLGKNILIVTNEDIIKAIVRLLHNYFVDEFENHQVPIDIPIVFEFSYNTREILNGYYLPSSLLERNTDNQNSLFPTGFNIDKEKVNSISDGNKQSSSPNIDVSLYKQQENLTEQILNETYSDIHEPIDLKLTSLVNDTQQEREEPGFAIASINGTALYELATPK